MTPKVRAKQRRWLGVWIRAITQWNTKIGLVTINKLIFKIFFPSNQNILVLKIFFIAWIRKSWRIVSVLGDTKVSPLRIINHYKIVTCSSRGFHHLHSFIAGYCEHPCATKNSWEHCAKGPGQTPTWLLPGLCHVPNGDPSTPCWVFTQKTQCCQIAKHTSSQPTLPNDFQ